MKSSPKNPKVDAFIKTQKKWKDEVTLLRQLALECGLNEDLKWRLPCYTLNDANIAIIQNFKDFVAIMFFKGFALKDPKGLLKQPGENSQSARRFEFTSVSEISKMKSTIKSYIKEAIKAEESNVKLDKKTTKQPKMPTEFKDKLDGNKKLKAAFENLTPGRQRLYLMHFSSAKQSATRIARVEKCIPKIMKGLGLND
ncbi:YdeI/OmpD-associated family protein [Bdellovibrio sp. HCB2-146]|uniref:YdeI/OmpD-associated family protein n=1 Tax=Bdellovibrio sp. HCB2-146 TaxID=3394362 RepID=UPI0039BCD83F